VHLDDVDRLARRLIEHHRLDDWQFGFNRRRRSLGLCWYERRRIELSIYFAARHDEAEVRDVILHEIAHALAGPKAGHGTKWRAICRKIGARPERCSDTAMPAGRWRATCPSCRQEFNRIRRPMRNRRYMCPTCGVDKGRLLFARQER
jgi:predicted SprT family Zn-dependent metalloprotease